MSQDQVSLAILAKCLTQNQNFWSIIGMDDPSSRFCLCLIKTEYISTDDSFS